MLIVPIMTGYLCTIDVDAFICMNCIVRVLIVYCPLLTDCLNVSCNGHSPKAYNSIEFDSIFLALESYLFPDTLLKN